jgi:hypothetical protein
LLPGSPAIDGGPSLLCGPYDQRGFVGWSESQVCQVNGTGLPQANCDIGAFDYHPDIYVPVCASSKPPAESSPGTPLPGLLTDNHWQVNSLGNIDDCNLARVTKAIRVKVGA